MELIKIDFDKMRSELKRFPFHNGHIHLLRYLNIKEQDQIDSGNKGLDLKDVDRILDSMNACLYKHKYKYNNRDSDFLDEVIDKTENGSYINSDSTLGFTINFHFKEDNDE